MPQLHGQVLDRSRRAVFKVLSRSSTKRWAAVMFVLLDENAAPVLEGDYVAVSDAPMYYLSIDARGELAFEDNTFGYGGILSHSTSSKC